MYCFVSLTGLKIVSLAVYIHMPMILCAHVSHHYNINCSMMRGRIKGTDSTINAILATAVLYELYGTAGVKFNLLSKLL